METENAGQALRADGGNLGADIDNALHADKMKDTSMQLSQDEKHFAVQVKRAVEASGELQPTTFVDADYARFALASTGNLQEALRCMKRMQWFRQEYSIDDSVEQGMYYLERFFRLQPGFILKLDIDPETSEGILTFDQGSLNPVKALQCAENDSVVERNWKITVIGTYYLMNAVQPSLESSRTGIFYILEAATMTFDNFCLTYETRLHDELWGSYPLKVIKVMVYNNSYASTIAWSLCKPLFPQKLRDVMESGCRVQEPDGQPMPLLMLTDLYLTPNPERANFYRLERARDFLTQRARNDLSFSL